MQELEYVIFMLAMCDVLLVVQDCLLDFDLYHLIQTAQRLYAHILAMQDLDTNAHWAKVIVVANKIPDWENTSDRIEQCQDTLNAMFGNTAVSEANGSIPLHVLPTQQVRAAMVYSRDMIDGNRKHIRMWRTSASP